MKPQVLLLGAVLAVSAAPSISPAEIIFSQDFENGLGPNETTFGAFSINDTLASLNNGTLMMGHSSAYGALGGDTLMPTYSYYEVALDLRGFSDVELRFEFSGGIEKDFDGFNVLATTEHSFYPPNGLIFPTARSEFQYDADPLVQHGSSSPELGAIAWSSPANPSLVVKNLAALFVLSEFDDEKMRIRFQFGTDTRTGGEGANFDNIVVGGTPLPDTDGDGMHDAYEDAHGLDKNTDDSQGDLDGDGVNNITEFNNCTDPEEEDTDRDGLSDGAETNTGTFVDADDTGSDPLTKDTDGDRLEDGEEVSDDNGSFSDPNKTDTDGDSFTDFYEVDAGSDPNDPNSKPVLTLRVEKLEDDALSLAIANIPPGETFHLRRSPDGMAFEPLSAPLDVTDCTPQPIAVPVDPSAEPTQFFQLYEGASPNAFMEMVPVGNAGNAPDPLNSRYVPGIGAVGCAYSIGKYEVTNAQYTAFLNAVAATDTSNLYNMEMGSDARGGIARFGVSGSYTYAVKPNMGDKPVNYVNWYDTVRFCNWLHNGRPMAPQTGRTTEDGAYTLSGITSTRVGTDPLHGANGRNAGARFWLPSENEWYKAAYHQPAELRGDVDNYWLYPTGSNDAPTVATADEFGNINNDNANIANYLSGANWNGQNGNVTTVGSGGRGSASYYGAFDMGDNVYEWNEQIIDHQGNRVLRGSAWNTLGVGRLRSWGRGWNYPAFESNYNGFRVAGP